MFGHQSGEFVCESVGAKRVHRYCVGSRDPGFSPDQGHCVVYLDNTRLYLVVAETIVG